jgi:hypothetical protein
MKFIRGVGVETTDGRRGVVVDIRDQQIDVQFQDKVAGTRVETIPVEQLRPASLDNKTLQKRASAIISKTIDETMKAYKQSSVQKRAKPAPKEK